MKRLITKIILYGFLLLVVLEIWVRVFHLAKDTPSRYLDEHNVEKWIPEQQGYSVTGNRRQNFSEYHINKSGFNSYREFVPTADNYEIALVGDSFIEGFHQNYYSSIGKKIEGKLTNVDVYEYGYAGYDMADQLHLIHKYKEQFDLIDIVILGIKYDNDLTRPEYKVIESRLALESPVNKLLKKSKLLVYTKTIGVVSSMTNFLTKTKNIITKNDINGNDLKIKNDTILFNERKHNLESLVNLYGFDKKRFYFLIDETKTAKIFMDYLNDNGYKYIKIGELLNSATKRTTLVYDFHWNDYGRTLVANEIAFFLKDKNR